MWLQFTYNLQWDGWQAFAPLSGLFRSSSKQAPNRAHLQIQTALLTSQTLDVGRLMPVSFPKVTRVRRHSQYRMTLTALHRDHKLQMHEVLSEGAVKCEPIKHWWQRREAKNRSKMATKSGCVRDEFTVLIKILRKRLYGPFLNVFSFAVRAQWCVWLPGRNTHTRQKSKQWGEIS